MYTPDLVIVLGPRSYLTLLGILTVVASFWYYERKWDEEGPAAYSEALDSSGEDYHIVEDGKKVKYVNNPDGSRDAISVSTEDFKEDDMVEIPTQELSKAMPLPIGLLIGFGIWAVGMLFDTDGTTDIAFSWNINYLIFLPVIAFLIAYPIRKATVKRDLHLKKKAVSGVFVAVIWLVVCGLLDGNTDASWTFCVFGALSLFASYHTLRRSRKMGVSWEIHGEPNVDTTFQSLSVLTMMYGLFLIWVGTNAADSSQYDVLYIPLYMNYRAYLVFASGLGIIVPSLVALDLSFDAGSEPIGYGLDGRVFAETAKSVTVINLESAALILDTPWLFIGGWIIFGFCAFMPFGYGFTSQKMATFAACVAICVVYGLKILPSYWNANVQKYKKYAYVYVGLLLLLALCIGLSDKGVLLMSLIGVSLIAGGDYLDMREKKRGIFWLQSQDTNPATTAFGIGHPLFVLGWIILCIAMAVPM